MKELGQHRVYRKKHIGTRWVDINNGDSVRLEGRSRLAANEINRGKLEDLFAATPPLGAQETLFS